MAEQFVKFADANGTPLLLTRKEVEQINTRLEFSHTIKVFGDNASRPLYLMPKEFDKGKRRWRNFGGDESKLLDVRQSLKRDLLIRKLQGRSDFLLMGLLAGAVTGLWFLGGGKGPAIAYATIDLSGDNIAKLIVPAAVAFTVVTVLMFAFIHQIKKKKGHFEIREG